MMQSVAEHQEVPKEDAIVKPVKGRKKWHRGQKVAAGQRGEPKEPTRGDCGSLRKLAAACRKVSCRAAVAWCKGNVFRKIRTQGNYGPQSKVTIAGRRTTRCAGVASLRRGVVRNNCTRAKVE
jgi:hypothetical protein